MNAVDRLMSEYIEWGGPIVTRAEAYRDCVARGIDRHQADYQVFARPTVSPPDDPKSHVDFLRSIQEAEAAR